MFEKIQRFAKFLGWSHWRDVQMAAKKNWRLAIRKYVDELKKEITIDRVILFGSYARGNPKSYSDIDLAIFSKDFKDKDEIRNMQYLFQKTMA